MLAGLLTNHVICGSVVIVVNRLTSPSLLSVRTANNTMSLKNSQTICNYAENATNKMTTRKISNSEVGTWLSCRRKYYYRFDLLLEPKKLSHSLQRGILFHLAMESFNIAYMEDRNKNFNDAAFKGASLIQAQFLNYETYDSEIAVDCLRIYNIYMQILEQRIDEWEILEAEQQHDLPINESYSMPIKLDLLVRERSTGEIALVDYKTCYDFWSDDQIALSAQASKYIGALRNDGIRVDKLFLEQIRYRKIKDPTMDQLFRRTTVKPGSAKIRNVMADHITASNSIIQYRALPDAQRNQLATRVLNPMVCKGCEVRDLCKSELDGGDIGYAIQVGYKKNTYDYNQIAPNVLEEL